jgi:asparagine synthetase B (glutamine-hydrolysing)
MERLPEDCTVVLDGTGNDYYFGIPSRAKGVHRYRLRLQVQERLPDPVWRSLVQLMARGPEKVRQLGRYWARPVEESFVAWEGWSLEELTALFHRPVSVDDTYLWQVMREEHTAGWLRLLTEVVARVWEPHSAYRKAVNFARAAGRGIRFPFIDARLADYVRNLPADLKFRGDVNKCLLRAYMHANLPGDIVEKPKSPFVFDLNRLLLNPVHRWPEELHNAGRLKVVPTWADAPVDALLASHRRAPADIRWQHRLYALSLLASVVAISQGYEPVVGETNR